jgi:hypothetical protein
MDKRDFNWNSYKDNMIDHILAGDLRSDMICLGDLKNEEEENVKKTEEVRMSTDNEKYKRLAWQIDEVEKRQDKLDGSLFGVEGKGGRLDSIEKNIAVIQNTLDRVADKLNNVNATLNNGLKSTVYDLKNRVENIEKRLSEYVTTSEFNTTIDKDTYLVPNRRRKDNKFIITVVIAALAAIGSILTAIL